MNATETMNSDSPDFEATPAGICEAARAGDVAVLEEILTSKPELLVITNPHNWTKTVEGHDISGSYNKTPVEVAAFFNQPKAVARLLEIGHASKQWDDQPTELYFGALRIAIAMGHADVVKAIETDILNLVDANPTLLRDNGERKDTLLFFAAQHGNMSLVRELLDRGADVTSVSRIGHTVVQTYASSTNVCFRLAASPIGTRWSEFEITPKLKDSFARSPKPLTWSMVAATSRRPTSVLRWHLPGWVISKRLSFAFRFSQACIRPNLPTGKLNRQFAVTTAMAHSLNIEVLSNSI